MLMKRITTITFLLFLNYTAFSQKLTQKFVDSITLVQLNSQQYEDLIDTAESALYDDIDFYNLRFRLGTAYYKMNNYEKALLNYEEAYQMNASDTVCQEYLYYSCLYTGREDEAKVVASKFSLAMQKKLNYKKHCIESVSLSYGYAHTSNIEDGKTTEISGNKYIYGEAMYQGPFFYTNILLEHRIKNRLKIKYGMWYYETKSLGAIQADKIFATQNFTNLQYQYNFSTSYYFKNEMDISVAGSYYTQSASSYVGKYDNVALTYDFEADTKEYNSNAIVLGIGKRMNKIYPSISFAKGSFLDKDLIQAEGSLLFYPFGNYNLYTLTRFSYQKEDTENRLIFFQNIGARIRKNLWVEEIFSYGTHLNYISKDAFLTYNNMGPIKIIIGLDLKYCFKHLEISLGYKLLQSEGTYFYYDSPTEIIKRKYNYINHLISPTLKWRF